MPSQLNRWRNAFSGFLCLTTGILLTLEIGFQFSQFNAEFYGLFNRILFAAFGLDYFGRILSGRRFNYLVTHPTDILLFFPVIYAFLPNFMGFTMDSYYQFSLIFIMLGRIKHVGALYALLRFKPAQTLMFSFVLGVFIGSLLLMLPISTIEGVQLSYIDALFTATSAICVTGLSTIGVSENFSLFGQSVIMILFQIGGLGIMTFSVFLTLFLGGKLSHTESSVLQETFSTKNLSETIKIFKTIFAFTFLIELLGALALFFAWHDDFSTPFEAVFTSLFHSISAFCNAGFSLFPDSLVSYGTTPSIVFTISLLIIFGGIGFPVVFNVLQFFKRRHRNIHLRMQTKLALIVTGCLLVYGTIAIYLTEMNTGLAGYSLWDGFLLSFFQSVTARTAGFNTMDIGQLMPSTLLIILTLMYVGASPGSTGGGIKTTTFGLTVMELWNTMRGRERLHLWNRKVMQHNVRQALSIIFLSTVLISFFLLLLLVVDGHSFLPSLFEIISAFGTVGLTMGITGSLSVSAKVLIILLMFIGRLGPLTIAFALSAQKSETGYDLPEENVLIT